LSRVCAVVVTRNRKDLLRICLRSILAQTRPADRILVVDNASTDGTAGMLDAEFASLEKLNLLWRLTLPENAGGAGGVAAGLRWSHCNKFDWTWVMHDGVELAPDCLKRMLAFEDAADMIQTRIAAGWKPQHHVQFAAETPWTRVDYCDFTGVLIREKILHEAGFPDLRYYNMADDHAYGYLAAQRGTSICLNYEGVLRNVPEAMPLNRTTFYLGIRNLFLDRDNLARSGARFSGPRFFFDAVAAVVRQLGRALESPQDASANTMATIDGLRDGLHKRFDRLPQC
jgi:GT2 family glycosyltransferase